MKKIFMMAYKEDVHFFAKKERSRELFASCFFSFTDIKSITEINRLHICQSTFRLTIFPSTFALHED